MEELRDLVRVQPISGFVVDPPQRLLGEGVHGVNLLIDRYWLRSYRANVGLFADATPAERSVRARRAIGKDRMSMYFDWRPSGWTEHCKTRGYPTEAHPVTIEVLLPQPPLPTLLAELPNAVGPHPVRYEYRPPCVAYAGTAVAPGSTVARNAAVTGAYGTLGGFLRDSSNGAIYGVSCEHVFGAASGEIVFDSGRHRTRIGQVSFASSPPQSAQGAKCNRVVQGVAIDAAIAELDPGVAYSATYSSLGSVDRVTPIADMTSDDPVVFFGAVSGQVRAKIGGLNVWRTVDISGIPHCMGDMFIVEPTQHQYVRAKLAAPGDSGAWILNDENGVVGWDGVLVAGDGPTVYCCFAEHAFAVCQAHNASLVLEP
jgi:hypothetical protein